MAIQLVSELRAIVWGPFEEPSGHETVGLNMIRFTGRTAMFAAGSAIMLALFNRFAKQQGAMPAIASRLLNASLSTAATSAAMFIFQVGYIIKSKNRPFSEFNNNTLRIERMVTYTAATAAIGAFLASKFFTGNQTVISIARYSHFPLSCCLLTVRAISVYHTYQLKKLNQTP